jgi:hypothetical protein
MKHGLLLTVFLAAALSLGAQELNFTVRVNAQKRQIVDPKVFQTLEQTISEFLNNTKWTEDVVQPSERITGNLLITIQEELSPTSFQADLAIQASRPVYGSNYETALINHIDRDIIFFYEQFQPLIFSRNAFNDNLSAVLSFYTYVILGLDYDSFSLYGGEPFLQIAQEILNNVPQSAASAGKGWRSIDGNRNRYWIIENLLSPRVRPLRQAWYEYHRHGLDMMSDNVAAGRAIVAKGLDEILKVHQAYPNSMIVQMFNNAKGKEIIEIFKGGPRDEKDKMVQIMSRIDAPNASEYRNIR